MLHATERWRMCQRQCVIVKREWAMGSDMGLLPGLAIMTQLSRDFSLATKETTASLELTTQALEWAAWVLSQAPQLVSCVSLAKLLLSACFLTCKIAMIIEPTS